MDPTTEAYGCMSILIMEWGPLPFQPPRRLPCMCRQGSLPWPQEWFYSSWPAPGVWPGGPLSPTSKGPSKGFNLSIWKNGVASFEMRGFKRSHFALGKGAVVGILFIRLPNGNVLFKIGFKSQCSGLKIRIWTPLAYSLYNSDTEGDHQESKYRKRKGPRTGPWESTNIQISRRLRRAGEIEGTPGECHILDARRRECSKKEWSVMSDATDSSS